MSFLIFYPAVATLALFVLGVILIILRFGPKLCNLRHHALPDHYEWKHKGYEQQITYA